MELSQLIPDLLYKHNCVILPGFGGFLANFKACELKEDRFLASPARKIIAFNQSLVENDGLLISALSNEKNITYDQAEKEVENYISFVKSRLDKYKNFEFKNIGTFYLNNESNLLFVPYQGLNFLERSFGLPDVKVKPIFNKEKVAKQRKSSSKVVEMKPQRQKKKSSFFQVAAASIIILMVAGFGTIYLNENRSVDRLAGYEFPSDQIKDKDQNSTASIISLDDTNESASNESDIEEIDDSDVHPEEMLEEIDESSNINPTSDETITINEASLDEAVQTEEPVEIVEEPDQNMREEPDNTINASRDFDLEAKYKSILTNRNYFHVMIGEFDSEPDAQKWLKRYQSKAYDAKIIDNYKQGKYLLSLEHFTKEEHATAFQREVRVSERRRTWIVELNSK